MRGHEQSGEAAIREDLIDGRIGQANLILGPGPAIIGSEEEAIVGADIDGAGGAGIAQRPGNWAVGQSRADVVPVVCGKGIDGAQHMSAGGDA